MSELELNSKIKELRELKGMSEELTAEIDSIQDSIKEQMTADGVDTLSGIGNTIQVTDALLFGVFYLQPLFLCLKMGCYPLCYPVKM